MITPYFENIRKEILQIIDVANEEILVAVYWFTHPLLFNRLLEKLEEGKRVSLIIHNDYYNNRKSGLDFNYFIKRGGNFYFSKIENPMHHKFCVVDSRNLINGSYNWTYYAEDRNSENIIVFKDDPVIAATFRETFFKLAQTLEPVSEIIPLTKFEISDFNSENLIDFLAFELAFEAKATGKLSLLDTALNLAPSNIALQKMAVDLEFKRKRKLKHSIGVGLLDNNYLKVIEKGKTIPISVPKIVHTIKDNQSNAKSQVYYGEKNVANENIPMKSFNLEGIPPKPAGEANLKYNFTIDFTGYLTIEFFSLDNGKCIDPIRININDLLEDF